MGATPFVLQDTQKVNFGLNLVDADGNVAALPAGDTLQVSSADPTIASVAIDATPAAGFAISGFFLGQAKLGTVQISGLAVGADGVTADPNIAAAVQSIQVVAGAATGSAFTLGTAVSQ